MKSRWRSSWLVWGKAEFALAIFVVFGVGVNSSKQVSSKSVKDMMGLLSWRVGPSSGRSRNSSNQSVMARNKSNCPCRPFHHYLGPALVRTSSNKIFRKLNLTHRSSQVFVFTWIVTLISHLHIRSYTIGGESSLIHPSTMAHGEDAGGVDMVLTNWARFAYLFGAIWPSFVGQTWEKFACSWRDRNIKSLRVGCLVCFDSGAGVGKAQCSKIL